jgi:hypothetical protein
LLPDFQVPNHIWAAVVPETQRDEAWCLRCFDQVATEQGVAWEVEGVSFHPVSGEWWRREAEEDAAPVQPEQGEGERITEAEAIAAMPHQDDRYEIRRLREALRELAEAAAALDERPMDLPTHHLLRRKVVQARAALGEDG